MKNSEPEIIDKVGEETLDALAHAPAFNAWMYEQFAEFVKGEQVLEIGSGLGNLTRHIKAKNVVASYYSQRYVHLLGEKKSEIPALADVICYDVSNSDTSCFSQYNFESVICLNVIEHIEDDGAAVRNIASLLPSGGHFIMLVPYSQKLFCHLDTELGHYRRYTSASAADLLRRNGFSIVKKWKFNLFGGLGWLVNGVLLRQKHLNPGSIRIFDVLVPLFKKIEHFGTPFGASVIVVGRKN